MTREEALDKDKALTAIIDDIRLLPSLFVTFGGHATTPNMVSRDRVIAIIQRYGFNESNYDHVRPDTRKRPLKP